jgi:hypothetical protein
MLRPAAGPVRTLIQAGVREGGSAAVAEDVTDAGGVVGTGATAAAEDEDAGRTPLPEGESSSLAKPISDATKRSMAWIDAGEASSGTGAATR